VVQEDRALVVERRDDVDGVDDAERRIELLAKDESGATTTRPLTWEEEER